MEAMLRALSDGTRRGILSLVLKKELPAGEIAKHFQMSRPAVSQHLRVLLESDLIRLRRKGTSRLYQGNREAIVKLRTELTTLWEGGLSRLKAAAESAKASQKHT